MGENEIYRVFEKRWHRLCQREDADEHWAELMQAATSTEEDWQSAFENNQSLRSALRELQKRFGLPKSSHREVLEWVEKRFGEYTEFNNRLDALLDRFGIQHDWRSAIYQRITWRSPSVGPMFRLGFRSSNLFDDRRDGEFELVLNPEVNLSNPFIQENILFHKVLNDPPPRPRILVDSSEGMMDWTPVWKWHERYPELSLPEIAELLNYSYAYVRQRHKESQARSGQ